MDKDNEIADAIRQIAHEQQMGRIHTEHAWASDSGEEFTFKFKDREQAMLAMRAMDLWSVLYDIDQKCRSILKYGEDENVELDKLAEDIRNDIWGTGLMDVVK
jgi:hypothetical protein